jgi:hypothetical protein
MALPAQLLSALTHPESVVFAENQASMDRLRKDDFVASEVENGILWHLQEGPSQLKIFVQPTGHAILYGEHGLRILYMDPGGTPLHECAWASVSDPPRLASARLYLDWGQWVGIKPEGLVNLARFDISQKPGWQRLTKEDLYRMAAQAMGVSPDEVAFFYDEDSLKLDTQGKVTIRHRKDALYVLKDGGFEGARFMACMGAMHWGRIDFLPVVELFQSLLAGTGSAVFELIRGLYDDQNREGALPLLRYRGIPTYPSPQAFQLFSTYFVPEAREGADPFTVFMDPARSSEVAWRPRSEFPYRFIDRQGGLSVTVAAGVVQKVTKRDDPVAMPYTRPTPKTIAAAGRILGVTNDALVLQEGDLREVIPLNPEWGVIQESSLAVISPGQRTWRNLFLEGAPQVDPERAYFGVPMYPEDETIMEELATQPLAIEQIIHYLKRLGLPEKTASGPSHRILIDQWDAVIADCLDASRALSGVILYESPEFAQRQAQRLWGQIATSGNPKPTSSIHFLPSGRRQETYGAEYDIILRWIPFEQYMLGQTLDQALKEVANALSPAGMAVVAGPPRLEQSAAHAGLTPEAAIQIADTAGVGMLKAILPNARVRSDCMLFLLRKPSRP